MSFLAAYVEAERTGKFDNMGGRFWLGTDPVVATAHKVRELAARVRAEWREQLAAPG